MINHKISVTDHDHSSHTAHGNDVHNHNGHNGHNHAENSHDHHSDDTHSHGHHSHDTHAATHTAHGVHEHVDPKKHAAHEHTATHNDGGHKHHESHGHGDHGNGGGHGDHGHGGGHGDHGHGGGHGDHGHGGGHGDHGHGGGHGGHGDHDSGSKMLGIIGLGAVLGLMVLLGIPIIFSQIDQILVKRDAIVDSPSDGLLSSYTVANAHTLYAVKVVAVEHLMMDTPKSSMPVTYLTLSTGERLMSMDMSAFKNQGISSSAVFMSKEAYQRAKILEPGKVNLKVTGEPPISLILTGFAPLIIELESLY